jgi:hypothetical protein
MHERSDEERMRVEMAHGLVQARWHGWASPVGLGLFILLVSLSVALLRMAFR